MLRDFKAFLLKENILALALGVIIGVALGAVVKAIVDDFILPVVSLITPAGDWRSAAWVVGDARFAYGDFLSHLLNFFIIGFVVWRISKAFIKPAPAAAAPPTKNCTYCKMAIDATATRCAHCTSQL